MTDNVDKPLLKDVVNKYLNKFNDAYNSSGVKHLVQKYEIHDIYGVFKLHCGPHWNFVLEDESYVLSCIVINRASGLKKLIDLNCCGVKITSGYITIECLKSSSQPSLYISLQCSPSEIVLLKRKSSLFWVMPVHTTRRIHIVHVTPPIVIENLFSFCLILTMVVDTDPSYLWILLKDKQVLWHNFLIPNRGYDFHMVEPQDYFKKWLISPSKWDL